MNYAEINAVNWSTLSVMDRSPLHYRYALEHPREDTDALQFGRAVHCLILEPDLYRDRYAVWTGADRRTRAGKEAWLAFQDELDGRTVLDSDTADAAHNAAMAALGVPSVRNLLLGASVEHTITWTDPVTHIDCKGRLDALRSPGRVVDIKTSRDISPKRFASAAAALRYHGQLAFYHDGAGCTDSNTPVIVAVESKPPHDVAVYDCGLWLVPGRALYRRLLDRLAECRRTDTWPGMVPEPMELDLPPWAYGADGGDDLDWSGT
jgi:exodeoxyribonuclease VIII